MKSSYIDNYAYSVVGNVSHNGGSVVLKVTTNEGEAKAFAAYRKAMGLNSSIVKPGAKPMVGRYAHGKGGKSMAS